MVNIGFEIGKEGNGQPDHAEAEALLNSSDAWRQRDPYEQRPVVERNNSLPSLYISFGTNPYSSYQPEVDAYGLPAYGYSNSPYESGPYGTNAYEVPAVPNSDIAQSSYPGGPYDANGYETPIAPNDQPIQYGSPAVPAENAEPLETVYGVPAGSNDQPLQYSPPAVPNENAGPVETGSGVQATSTCENPPELQQQGSPVPSTAGALVDNPTQVGVEVSNQGAPLNPGTGPVEYSSQGTDSLPGATFMGFEQNVPDTSTNPLGELWHGITDTFGNNTLQDQVTKKVVSQLTPDQLKEYNKESAEIRSREMLDTMAPLPPLSTPMHDMVNNRVQNVEHSIASQVQSQMSPHDLSELQSEWNQYNAPQPPVNPYGGPAGQYHPKPGPAIQEYYKQLGETTEHYLQQG